MADTPHRQIVGLDLIRFSAALMVMTFHLCFWIWAGPASSTALRASGSLAEFNELSFLAFGRVGVETFFVLSGFIIAYSAQRASAYEFFRSRAVRLVPAVWIIAPITLIAALLSNFAASGELALRFLRTLSFFPVGPIWMACIGHWALKLDSMSSYSFCF